jgi:hypothetical protein
MAAAVPSMPSFRAGNPTPLFESRSLVLDGRMFGNTGRTYHVSRDGQRFLMLKDTAAGETQQPGIIVVQNWIEELRVLVPVAR